MIHAFDPLSKIVEGAVDANFLKKQFSKIFYKSIPGAF